MISLIVASIAGAFTTVVCASLSYANALDKREWKDEKKSEVKIWPNVHPGAIDESGRCCPLCGSIPGPYKEHGVNKTPTACKKASCPASHKAHLHAHCVSCNSDFFTGPYVKE